MPATNQDFWAAKIALCKERDLGRPSWRRGWLVLRFWATAAIGA